jgi:hypothetical protein
MLDPNPGASQGTSHALDHDPCLAAEALALAEQITTMMMKRWATEIEAARNMIVMIKKMGSCFCLVLLLTNHSFLF